MGGGVLRLNASADIVAARSTGRPLGGDRGLRAPAVDRIAESAPAAGRRRAGGGQVLAADAAAGADRQARQGTRSFRAARPVALNGAVRSGIMPPTRHGTARDLSLELSPRVPCRKFRRRAQTRGALPRAGLF